MIAVRIDSAVVDTAGRVLIRYTSAWPLPVDPGGTEIEFPSVDTFTQYIADAEQWLARAQIPLLLALVAGMNTAGDLTAKLALMTGRRCTMNVDTPAITVV